MRQRLALGGLSMAVICALIFVFTSSSPSKLVAMEEIADSIRSAKSYQLKVTTELQDQSNGPEKVAAIQGKFFWQAPKSIRMEMDSAGPDGGLHTVSIYPADSDGITIDHRSKTFHREPARRGFISPMMLLDGLGQHAMKATRELGTKEIDGTQLQGFIVDATAIDPDIQPGPVEIWVDPSTKLPQRIRYYMNEGPKIVMTMSDFEWDVQLDPKLFDTTPPEGYRDVTQKEPTIDEQLADIKNALQVYAEFSGGHYPRVKMVYGDATRDQLLKLAGIPVLPSAEQMQSEKYAKIQKSVKGFARINAILRDNADAAYFGRTVGPQDQDKVLLRWQLEEQKYQVIFGDLRTETMTADQLAELENK